MKYAILRSDASPIARRIESDITHLLATLGHTHTSMDEDIRYILNFTTLDAPDGVRRKAQNEFVVSIGVLDEEVEDLRYLCYNTLVKTLSNLFLCVKARGDEPIEVHAITPEVGFYHFPYSPQNIYTAMEPVITAHFAINNQIRYDLPASYCSSPIARQIQHYGAELDALGLLPAPFPIEQVLSKENIEHLYRLFHIRGLSYGNLSAREKIPEIGPDTFWMTARGVDKAHLQGVGKDILLVEGFDEASGEIWVRIPPDGNPKIRVSVDAIEHLMIYRAFPEVGAIVHVHAWMQQVPCTRQNYPCGTVELATAVCRELQQSPDPGKAVIGLKNHGLTITGPHLGDIFSRIKGKLLKEVPMMA